MRTLAFDGRMGAAGDMVLGALLAAGADRDALAPVETCDALEVAYEVRDVERNGIAATSVDVVIPDGEGHDHSHSEAEGHGPHRTYEEVVDLVEGMALPADVRADALAVFEVLGEAEAAVHGTDLAETHFHEVGADDAIADVVGAALLLADLDPGRVVTTPLAAGGGTVSTSHGEYPVPAPAVVEIAERADWELRGGPVDAELLTPTGAAVLAHVAEGVDSLPSLRIAASGYGAGDRAFPERPNVLRALVGEDQGGLVRDDVRVLETNLDDASPEVLGGLQASLSDSGARDVTVVPTTMKKSRPGHLVKVVVDPEDAERVAHRLAEETGTLGVRDAGARHRWIADRSFRTAVLDLDGESREVAVKVALDAGGAVYDVSAEYDDAAAVAREADLPVREVLRRAEEAVREGGGTDDRLVHVLEAEDWEPVAAGEVDAYRPPSLDEEGYVHLSTVEQVLAVAQYNHADDDEPRLLVLDREALADGLKFEEMPGGAYPHYYGPVDPSAVVDVLAFPREDGRFVLPDDLRDP